MTSMPFFGTIFIIIFSLHTFTSRGYLYLPFITEASMLNYLHQQTRPYTGLLVAGYQISQLPMKEYGLVCNVFYTPG
jgi:hypothetical protein